MTWSEERRLENVKFGGVGIEVETDAFEVRAKQKSGAGRISPTKCYVQYLGERGGDILLHVFANPQNGPERLEHVRPILDQHLADGSILLTDSARCYDSYVMDRPAKQLMHCKINHAEKKDHGFVWLLWVDEKDGAEFTNFDGERIIQVSTENADGYASVVKAFLKSKGGVKRHLAKAFIKEQQWRTNNVDKDLYDYFLTCWGEVEYAFRNEGLTRKEFDSCIKWDDHAADDGQSISEEPCWVCPGCSETCIGKRWSQLKAKHRRTCKYYTSCTSERTYCHATSRCMCCVFYKNIKIKATKVPQGTQRPRHKLPLRFDSFDKNPRGGGLY